MITLKYITGNLHVNKFPVLTNFCMNKLLIISILSAWKSNQIAIKFRGWGTYNFLRLRQFTNVLFRILESLLCWTFLQQKELSLNLQSTYIVWLSNTHKVTHHGPVPININYKILSPHNCLFRIILVNFYFLSSYKFREQNIVHTFELQRRN